MTDLGKPNSHDPHALNELGAQNQGLIKDGTTQSFMADVIEQSKHVPVIVDFWAPNCAPCAQLTPALEAEVNAANGNVKLVKINTQANPDLAAQFRIQSVPTVYIFKDGQPIDGFAGAMPQSEIKKLIQNLSGENEQLAEALAIGNEHLENNDAQSAAEVFAHLLTIDPENPEAIAGLIKCYIKVGDLDIAAQTLDAVTVQLSTSPAILSAKAALELAQKANDTGDLEELVSAVNNDPKNFDKRYELAIAFNAKNRHNDALEQLITILQQNREWNEGKARTQLLELFEAWGPKNPATVAGRRQLSSLLF